MKRSLAAIPTLLAAGLVPSQSLAGEDDAAVHSGQKGFLDNLEVVVSDISEAQSFTLAQHRSHASHASHGSHRSHRSSSYLGPTIVPQDEAGASFASQETGNGRNEMSTPRSAILPSSPAIAKKVKRLPGNSKKFRETVSRLQVALMSRGYDVSAVSGELDARTISAIYRYQSEVGLIPTGKVSDDTLGSLGIIAR